MKKRADGRYQSQIYLGQKPRLDNAGNPVLDKNGKPRMMRDYKVVYGNTQKEVRQQVAELKIMMGKGIDVSAADDTFKAWADRFMQSKVGEGISAAYIDSLNLSFKHLAPINDIPIIRVETIHVQDIINKLAIGGCKGKPLSKRSLILIKQACGQVFKYAIATRATTYNPVEFVVIPKSAKTTKREALSDTQQQWVIETPHRAQRAAMLMMFSGLRRGEATALTWADIDLSAATIRVTKATEFIKGKPRVKAPKTTAGNRIINIPDILVDFLKQEQKNDSHLYVLYNKKGEMLTESAWRRMWESYMRDLNVKYGYPNEDVSKFDPKGLSMRIETFTLHQLRHTFASILYFANPKDALYAKEQLGHANIQTTLDIYTHLDKKHEKHNAKSLNEYVNEAYL